MGNDNSIYKAHEQNHLYNYSPGLCDDILLASYSPEINDPHQNPKTCEEILKQNKFIKELLKKEYKKLEKLEVKHKRQKKGDKLLDFVKRDKVFEESIKDQI